MPVAVVAHLVQWTLVRQLSAGNFPGAVHLLSIPVQVLQVLLAQKRMSQWGSE